MKRLLLFLLPLAVAPAWAGGFFDDFDGEDLGEHWFFENPKGAMNYAVHDSLLEILSFENCQGCSHWERISVAIAPYDDFDMHALVGWDDAPTFQGLGVELGFGIGDIAVAGMYYMRVAGGDPANRLTAKFRDGPSAEVEAPATGFHEFRLARKSGIYSAYFDGHLILQGSGSAMQPRRLAGNSGSLCRPRVCSSRASLVARRGFGAVCLCVAPPKEDTLMSWHHVNGWPSGLTAIHAIHLHNGTVVMWGYGEAGSNKRTKAWVWDIASGMFYQLDSDLANLYCSGHAMMPDGAVLVAGGQDDRVPPPPGPPFDYGDGWGTIWAVALVPDDSAPSRARWLQRRAMDNQGAEPPPWDYARWYPTLTTAPDGSVLATSGTEFMTPQDERVYNKKIQLYDPTADSWFTAPIEQQLPLYPAMFVIPPGFVFYAGRAITPTPPGDKTLALRLSDFT